MGIDLPEELKVGGLSFCNNPSLSEEKIYFSDHPITLK
jgi:hypothetical protein